MTPHGPAPGRQLGITGITATRRIGTRDRVLRVRPQRHYPRFERAPRRHHVTSNHYELANLRSRCLIEPTRYRPPTARLGFANNSVSISAEMFPAAQPSH